MQGTDQENAAQGPITDKKWTSKGMYDIQYDISE